MLSTVLSSPPQGPAASAIDQIQDVLTSVRVPGTFATRRTVSAEHLHLDVCGSGPLQLPVTPAIARMLADLARPARYGLRHKTLLDRRVRDTEEIGKAQIKIDAKRWQRALAPELEEIARDLGLPAGTTLRAKLHNLLVYGPGQFFAPHQDSEKANGMIGSLVVLLPSDSSGGALVVKHHDEKVSYRGSPDELVLVAFYADCRHEVRPVTRGYRVALTYNLFLEGAKGARPPAGPTTRIDTLVDLVRDYFATPRPTRSPLWPSKGPPERLVYLLDHEYTQKGLSWRALKNGDAVRAGLLRHVAERLDCEIVLALADVHETWSCEDDWDDGGYGYGRRRSGWYGEYEDEEDGEGDDEARDGREYALIELCDSDIELRHWLAPSGKRVQAISDEVIGDEVCFTKPSVDLEPFKSEHEGYTGNAGNTVDRWYHRAAVLLWPRARTFAIRAKAAPAWGILEIAKELAHGDRDVARQRSGDLLSFWTDVARRDEGPDFVEKLLQVACDIEDAKLATALLDPIAIERLTPRASTRWLALIERYGLTWGERVFTHSTSRDKDHYDHARRASWLLSLPKFCAPLCASGKDARELVRGIVRAQWAWLDALLTRQCKSLPSSYALKSIENLGRAIVALLASAALVEDPELPATIVDRLSAKRGYPVAGAMAVLRAGEPHGGTMLGLVPLHEDCINTLTKFTATPPREAGDWSITTSLRCKCDLCARLKHFLRARNEQQHEWPLAKDRRAHVHQTITSHELPLTHVTRHVGSPHTLVLTKTRALYKREKAERAAWVRDLAWLRRTATTFAAPARRQRRRAA